MATTTAIDALRDATGWFAVDTASDASIRLHEHETLGVDERGQRTDAGREAAHACRVRTDRGLLRLEAVRGDVTVDGRPVLKRALVSESCVLRLGHRAFFLTNQTLETEPDEVVNELPGIWQPFVEEMEIDGGLDAIPEPAAADAAQPAAPAPTAPKEQRVADAAKKAANDVIVVAEPTAKTDTGPRWLRTLAIGMVAGLALMGLAVLLG